MADEYQPQGHEHANYKGEQCQWECCHCLGTYTGTFNEMRHLGWFLWPASYPTKPVRFALCDECKQLYIERREAAMGVTLGMGV